MVMSREWQVKGCEKHNEISACVKRRRGIRRNFRDSAEEQRSRATGLSKFPFIKDKGGRWGAEIHFPLAYP